MRGGGVQFVQMDSVIQRRELADERAVKLQKGEIEFLDVIERRKADAKIVEREPAAEALDALHEVTHFADVVERSCFGQFENDARRIDPQGFYSVFNELKQLRIADRFGGQVDGHAGFFGQE